MYSHLAKVCGLSLATGLLAATLAGCVSIEPSNDGQSPSSSPTTAPAENTPPIEGTVTPSAKNPDGEATGSGTVPKETAGDSFSQAFEIIEAKAIEKKCTGKMALDSDGEMVKLIGNCQQVEITGTGNMVVGGRVKDLSISGNGNIVAVNNIEDVSASGVGNSVAWRNDNASAHDSGQSNRLGPDALSGVDLGY